MRGTLLIALTLLATGDGMAKTRASPLVIEDQGSFFVGGRETSSSSLSTSGIVDPAGTVTVDQIYVRFQVPHKAVATPIIFIHGCCLTGKSWETTPDGRMGWEEYFLRNRFPTYTIDQSWRGRSGGDPSSVNAAAMGNSPSSAIAEIFSVSHEDAWVRFRFGEKYGVAFPGQQFPTESVAEFWKQLVPDYSRALLKPNPTVPALAQLAQRIGHAVLIGHSQSGIYPFQAAEMAPEAVSGIIAIEPAACPDTPPASDKVRGIPVLVMFGDYVPLSTAWSRRLDQCRSYIAAAHAAGMNAQLLLLPEHGIYGNSHMIMQDKNNIQIAEILIEWIEKNIYK